MKISIQQGLNELKLLDKRIMHTINNITPVTVTSRDKIAYPKDVTSHKSDDFIKNGLSNYQSALDLIDNRNKIKSAIVLSNASTKVSIGIKEYTVAEAIERKNSIHYEECLLNKLKIEYTNAKLKHTHLTDEVNTTIETRINSVLGNNTERKQDTDSLIDAINKLGLDELPVLNSIKYNGSDLEQIIDTLQQSIDTFLSEIDYKLTESNVQTYIEI